MRIVVDVMGGDHGCGVVIGGAHGALQANPQITKLFLVGRQSEIEPVLERSQFRDPRLQIVHANEVLTMSDKPVHGLRRKHDSSIARAVELVKTGEADALVSPGNTGGVVAAATIRLRPLPGLDRPGIAAVIPTEENAFVLLDAGANIECRPMHLAHYAILGHVYAQQILGYPQPRVGLLSIGTEDCKGNDLTLEAFKLCKQLDLNFIGNVEGHDLFANRVDVVVCDGFVGNIVLKTCESLALGLMRWLRKELTVNWTRKIGASLARGAFRNIKSRMDPDAHGGAPLLGLNGNVMIAHGSARERAIMNAIQLTSQAVQNQINSVMAREIARANERFAAHKLAVPASA